MPTGMLVSQQDEKSQIRNKVRGLKILRWRIYESERQKRDEVRSQDRKIKIETRDRQERIKTYTLPQGRVTDHRIGLTLYDLPKILDGDVSKLIDEIKLYINTEKLKEAGEV